MRILVQDCKTHKFLRQDGTRTLDLINAYNFESTIKALNFCQDARDTDLQIIMKFERDEFDVTLPVSSSCKELARN